MQLLLCGKLARRNITKESKKTIDEAIIELTLEGHEEAEQKFSYVVNDLIDRMNCTQEDNLFHMSFGTTAFGQRLAQGMQEYDESDKSGELRYF